VLNFKRSIVEHKNVEFKLKEFALSVDKILPDLEMRPIIFQPSLKRPAISGILL
jgi:hypothetical protein